MPCPRHSRPVPASAVEPYACRPRRTSGASSRSVGGNCPTGVHPGVRRDAPASPPEPRTPMAGVGCRPGPLFIEADAPVVAADVHEVTVAAGPCACDGAGDGAGCTRALVRGAGADSGPTRSPLGVVTGVSIVTVDLTRAAALEPAAAHGPPGSRGLDARPGLDLLESRILVLTTRTYVRRLAA